MPKNFHFAVVMLLVLSTCARERPQEDMQYREVVKKYLSDYYDTPVAKKMNEVENSEDQNDRLYFDSLQRVIKYKEWRTDWRFAFDSLLLLASGLEVLPRYKPQETERKKDYEEEDFAIILTREVGAFGLHAIDLIYIEKARRNTMFQRRSFRVDRDCHALLGSKKMSADCFEETQSSERMLAAAEIDSIKAWYMDYDLGRISFYHHASHLICDGYSYEVRLITEWTDKITQVDCPSERNPVYQFYKLVEAL